MCPSQAQSISYHRLEDWREQMRGIPALPLALLWVEHGQNAGQIHISIPEDVTLDEIAAVLEDAARMLRVQARGVLVEQK